MSNNNNKLLPANHLIQLNYLYAVFILLLIGIILTTAMYYQYVYHELPCPLCLLQRAAYLGIAFGILSYLRNGYSLRYDGLIQLVTIILLIISTRQTLLDIYPRQGHAYIGSAILGLHMPVWSIVISIFLLFLYAVRLCALGNVNELEHAKLKSYPRLATIANFLMIYMILLCATNLLSSLLQCGFASCHTFGYRLLNTKLDIT